MSTLFNKWRQGLAKTSQATFGQLAGILGASDIEPETWDDLEEILIRADLGMETVDTVLDRLEQRVDSEGMTRTNQLMRALAQELRGLLSSPPAIDFSNKPTVILVVGVNGSGKTTSIAKLGQRFTQQGKRVLLGAADTFRAAAVDQLEIWADRLGLPIISGQLGGDAGAVAFDSVAAAQSRGSDIVLIDTAGRLHTRFNLMEELKKVYRVVSKAMPGAPHHVWLVMDATTGQNALQQARAFKQAVNVTGVILAKLDSSARGGMAFAIQHDLGLPILYAGLGEKPDDLQPFDPDAFIRGLLEEDGKQ
jgi:fused signal recognition particle receptor